MSVVDTGEMTAELPTYAELLNEQIPSRWHSGDVEPVEAAVPYGRHALDALDVTAELSGLAVPSADVPVPVVLAGAEGSTPESPAEYAAELAERDLLADTGPVVLEPLPLSEDGLPEAEHPTSHRLTLERRADPGARLVAELTFVPVQSRRVAPWVWLAVALLGLLLWFAFSIGVQVGQSGGLGGSGGPAAPDPAVSTATTPTPATAGTVPAAAATVAATTVPVPIPAGGGR